MAYNAIEKQRLKDYEKNLSLVGTNRSSVNMPNPADIPGSRPYLDTKSDQIRRAINTTAPYVNTTRGQQIASTLSNTALLFGKGAVKSTEGMLDFLNDITGKVNAIPLSLVNKEAAEQERESYRNFVQRDLTGELGANTGISDIITRNEKLGSAVRRNNLGGLLAEAVGSQVPTILIGAATGIGGLNSALEASNAGTLSKIGMSVLANAPTTSSFAARSYGGALEEAYREGATYKEATKYAIASTAVEIASEWITGGLPGTNGKGGLDVLVDKGIDKISNKLIKDLAKYGYKMVGEGLEEAVSEILSPLIKNATYTQGENINWADVINSAIIGGLSSGIIESPGVVNSMIRNIKENNVNINSNNIVEVLENEKQILEEKVPQTPEEAIAKENQIAEIENMQNVLDKADDLSKLTDEELEDLKFAQELFELDTSETNAEIKRRTDYIDEVENMLLNQTDQTQQAVKDAKDLLNLNDEKPKKTSLTDLTDKQLEDLKTSLETLNEDTSEVLQEQRNREIEAKKLLEQPQKIEQDKNKFIESTKEMLNLKEEKPQPKKTGEFEYVQDTGKLKEQYKTGYEEKATEKQAKGLAEQKTKSQITLKGKELNLSDKEIAYKQAEIEQLENNKVTKATTMEQAIETGNVIPTKNGSYVKNLNEEATNQVISLIIPSENKATVKTQDVYNNDVKIKKPSKKYLENAKTNGEIIDKLESTKTTSQKTQDKNDELKMERTYARRKEKIDDDNRLTEYEKTEMEHMFKSLSLNELEQKWTDAVIEDVDNVIEKLNVEILNNEITPDTIAKAAVLGKYYDQQGDFITADEYYQLASTALHNPARTLATAKLIYQDNPMGAYMSYMRSIENLYKHDAKYHKNDIAWHEKNDLFNSDGSINKNSPYRLADEVKQDLGAKIREWYQIENPNSKEAKSKKMEIDTLLSNNLPNKPNVEKIMDFRRSAMLNSVGIWIKNSRQELIDLTVGVTTDIGSSPADRYLQKIRNKIENEVRQQQGEETKQKRYRTTSILTTSGKEFVNGYKDGIKNHWESIKNDVVLNRYSELAVSNTDRVSATSEIKRKSNNKVQQFIDKSNAFGMGADERFREAYFATSLYDQQAQFALNMAANKNKKAVARTELTAGGAKITFADPDTLTLQYELVPNIKTNSELISYLDDNYISPTEKDVNNMLDRASQIANYRTMQDSGALTRFTNKMLKTIDDFTIEHLHIPLGSAIAPFYRASTESLRTLYKSTPLAAIDINNKIKAFEKAVRDNATGDNTTNNLFDMQYSLAKDIGQAVGGTIALAIGGAIVSSLKKKGAIVGSNPDDKKDEKEYTIKIGDKNYSFNIDTVTTNGLKFLSIINDDKNISTKEGESIIKNIEKTISNFANPILDMVLEQTALSSFAEYGETKYRSRADNIWYQLGRVPASFIPTLSKNIASIFDGFTARDTSSDTMFGKMVNAIGSKIPIVRSMYAEKKDKWNSTEEAGLNILEKMWNSFVSNDISSRKVTPLDQELYDVYLATGSTDAFPTTGLSNEFTRGTGDNKAKYTLSKEEQIKYQQTYGEKAFNTLEKLMNTNTYKESNNKDKLTMIRAAYNYAKTYAQNKYLDTKEIYYDIEETAIEKVINQDISYTSAQYQKENPERWKLYTSIINNYDDYKEIAKNINDIKDTYSSANGFSATTRRNMVANYVNGLSNLNATKKAMLIKISGFQSSYSSYDNSIIKYLKTLNLTEEEYEYFIKGSNLGLNGYYVSIYKNK